MVFSSSVFLFYFLPLFLICYFALPFKNLVLLVFSLFFYAWGEGLYVLLMIASGIGNWALARWIADNSGSRARAILAIGVALNLAGLFVFKYLGFFVESWNDIVPAATLRVPYIHLPIGISFFTFHAISYLVDVYRGDFKAERDPVKVLLYIAMFPQLIAGPIVRFGTVRKEIHERVVTVEKFALGLKFFIIGLGQKVLIANTLAVPVDAIYKIPVENLDAPLAWLANAGYALQIYFDFAGYSNMAIGLGLMIGIYFPLNFNYPYIAQSITEFWRRWHITLSTWFRDYLYIPLGGSRAGAYRTYFNLMVVFLLCGLWHGAKWTFVVWGLYHGFFLILERAGLGAALQRIGSEFRHLYVILVVTVGWVFFRADDLSQALSHLRAMAGFGSGDGIAHHVWLHLQPDVALALIIGAVGSTPYLANLGQRIVAYAGSLRRGRREMLDAAGGGAHVRGALRDPASVRAFDRGRQLQPVHLLPLLDRAMRQQLPALGLSLGRLPSVLLAVAVLATLFAPALIQLTGRQTDPSFLDNRPPARMPALPSSFSLGALGQFRKELIAFIDDNFGLRAEMVKLNIRVRSAIGVSAIPGLFKGKEGWFFLKTDSDVLDQVRALNRFTDEELDEWIDLMEAQQRWVKAQGAAMVIVVAPNQHTIYPERMPLYVNRVWPETRLDQIMRRLQERGSSLVVVDPRRDLWAARQQNLALSQI